MLGETINKPSKSAFDLDYVGIKASQFSFSRLQGADPVLGVDMASTGEVGCIGDDTSEAILKAMISVGHRVPEKGVLFSNGNMKQKISLLDSARRIEKRGLTVYATEGTCKFLNDNGVKALPAYFPGDDRKPQIIDLLQKKEIDLVVNIPKNLTVKELSNGYKIRRAAVDLNVPLITNTRLAAAFIRAFCEISPEDVSIKAWDEY